MMNLVEMKEFAVKSLREVLQELEDAGLTAENTLKEQRDIVT